jgi:CO/xanthine dehydrogenase Mo-binding subunit
MPRTQQSSDLRRAKITGEPVFASDFRPSHFRWPEECRYALILRASCVNRPFCGVALNGLSADNQPMRLVTAEQIEVAGFKNESGINGIPPWFCKVGDLPAYASQPVAILLFKDFITFRRAAQEIREDRGIVRYGQEQQLSAQVPLDQMLEEWRDLKTTNGYSQWHYMVSKERGAETSQWLHGSASLRDGKLQAGKNVFGLDDLYARLRSTPNAALAVTTRTFTQQVDPAFLEPESGLAYLEGSHLRLLTATQSPHGDAQTVKNAMNIAPGKAIASLTITNVDSGGSFGGRDKAPFVVQLAIAAAFSDKPVRLAYDRFEQFQAGMKRHAAGVCSSISATPEGLLDQAHVHLVLEGGAEPNLGTAVLGLATLHGTSMYRFREAGCHGIVTRRPIPIVGSMRGFGIPQVNFNIETAIDKLAVQKLKEDPIAFRARNALKWNAEAAGADCDMAGTPLRFHVATREICDVAAAHPLWLQRHERREEKLKAGVFRGVGFAACIEAYGTSADPIFAALELNEDGSFTVWSQTYDMGQGARRSMARAAASTLGAPVQVILGSQEPFERFNVQLPEGVSKKWGASSASKTAFFHVHVLTETARVFVEFVVKPCAESLLERSVGTEELLKLLADGTSNADDTSGLTWKFIARKLNEAGQARFAIGHGHFENGWASAKFSANGRKAGAWLDAVGLSASSETDIQLVEMTELKPAGAEGPGLSKAPRSVYAGGGHLVAVEVDPTAGSIRVTDALAIVDAGDPLMRTQLEGQIEGGFQMGLAHAMFEELPTETGEDRFVNFDRYILPRASDLLGIKLHSHLLPLPREGALNASQPNLRHKGVAEVTMTTVAAALSNAIAHALGHHDEMAWPTKLPIRFADLVLPKVNHA